MVERTCRLRSAAVLYGVWCAGCALGPAPLSRDWQEVAVPTRASLRGIAAVDRDSLWVTGSAGTVLRTDDAGRTWRSVSPPECGTVDFRDVHAFDARTALVMTAGQPAQLWRTEDAGATWRLVFTDPDPAAFFDAVDGRGDYVVMYGDPTDGGPYVAESFDGGRTFARRTAGLPSIAPGEAGFAASGTCVHAFGQGAFGIVTGGGAVRFLGVHDGLTWAVALPLRAGAASRGAFSVAFDADGERGIAVGGDYAAPEQGDGTAAWSDDGGRTWHPAARPPGGYRSAAVWLDDGLAFATGSHGSSVTYDGGRTWSDSDAPRMHCLSRGDDTLWAAGAGGAVARLLLSSR